MPQSELWWDNDPTSIAHDLLEFITSRRPPVQNGNPMSILTLFEEGNVMDYWKMFDAGRMGDMDKTLQVASINQTPDVRWTTSHEDGSLPTFIRSGPQKLLSRTGNRWLTAREKLAASGFPVTPEMASGLGVEMLDVHKMDKPHARVGNGQVLPNTGMVLLSMLACIELYHPDRCVHHPGKPLKDCRC